MSDEPSWSVTVIKEANLGGTTVGVQGCEVESTKDDIAAAVAAAKDADVVVMVMGIGQHQEREGQDRYNTTRKHTSTRRVRFQEHF